MAFRGAVDAYPNLTVKKIPRQVLDRCEWGHDDHSLKVENLSQQAAPVIDMAVEGRGRQRGDAAVREQHRRQL